MLDKLSGDAKYYAEQANRGIIDDSDWADIQPIERGGKGSGHHGHGGLPGVHGGSTPSGGGHAFAKQIDEIREEIKNLPFERVIVLDEDGERVHTVDGTASQVDLSEIYDRIAGMTTLHNHPFPTGPISSTDVAFHIQNSIKETIVIAGEDTYSLVSDFEARDAIADRIWEYGHQIFASDFLLKTLKEYEAIYNEIAKDIPEWRRGRASVARRLYLESVEKWAEQTEWVEFRMLK